MEFINFHIKYNFMYNTKKTGIVIYAIPDILVIKNCFIQLGIRSH